MTKLYTIRGYRVTIWSNEYGEPVHVHVSKDKSPVGSTKLWLLSNGNFVLADQNDRRIPHKDLKILISKLNLVSDEVRNYWLMQFGYIKYYR